MTVISTDRETFRGSGSQNAHGLMSKMKGLWARNRAERQLHQLDDRLLADIGLSRGEITARVWSR